MGGGTIIGIDHQLPPAVTARKRRIHSRAIVWTVLTIAALTTAIALFLHHRRDAKRPPPSTTKVSTTAVAARRGDIGVYLESIGTVTPVYTASITTQVSGLVVRVHYVEGQRVQTGAPLIDVDSRPYRATLMQAEGALQRDRNLLAQARMDLERYRAAWARHAIAKQQLDDQEKLVLQTEGTVTSDEGVVRFDRIQVDYCRITAPIAGRVGLRLVDPGNVLQVASGQTLVVITQMDPITVVFTIAEDSIGEVQAGLKAGAPLTVDALDRAAQKTLVSGRLLTLNNQVDTTTGTVKARAVFDNADERLFPNQFVNTRLLVETLHDATLLPATAIQQNGPASFVYVIRDGVAHTRKVKPRVSDRGLTAVDGIAPGEQVATGSFDRLHDGIEVTTVPADGRAPP
ncbi:MAG: efflux transporter, family, subunit [Myxococcales bacterium]|nr:efflux transporter, family, subunit [Myxococcales bacterium]